MLSTFLLFCILSRARAIDHLLYQWRLVALGDRRVWQSSKYRRQSPISGPRQTIAPAIPDTRGFGSPYRLPFGPFLFPISCLASHQSRPPGATLEILCGSPSEAEAISSLIPFMYGARPLCQAALGEIAAMNPA